MLNVRGKIILNFHNFPWKPFGLLLVNSKGEYKQQLTMVNQCPCQNSSKLKLKLELSIMACIRDVSVKVVYHGILKIAS